jgi:hypothetical protein
MSDRAADRVAIADLIVRYSLHFDAQQGAEFAALFTANATFVRPDGTTVVGTAALEAMADAAPAMQHFPTPAAIDFAGEDLAHARSRVIALRADTTALHMVTAAEYADELQRVGDDWRIHERKVLAWLPSELTNVQLAAVE